MPGIRSSFPNDSFFFPSIFFSFFIIQPSFIIRSLFFLSVVNLLFFPLYKRRTLTDVEKEKFMPLSPRRLWTASVTVNGGGGDLCHCRCGVCGLHRLQSKHGGGGLCQCHFWGLHWLHRRGDLRHSRWGVCGLHPLHWRGNYAVVAGAFVDCIRYNEGGFMLLLLPCLLTKSVTVFGGDLCHCRYRFCWLRRLKWRGVVIVAVAFGDCIGYIGRRRGYMQLSAAGFVDCIGYTGGGGLCNGRCCVCGLHRLQWMERGGFMRLSVWCL